MPARDISVARRSRYVLSDAAGLLTMRIRGLPADQAFERRSPLAHRKNQARGMSLPAGRWHIDGGQVHIAALPAETCGNLLEQQRVVRAVAARGVFRLAIDPPAARHARTASGTLRRRRHPPAGRRRSPAATGRRRRVAARSSRPRNDAARGARRRGPRPLRAAPSAARRNSRRSRTPAGRSSAPRGRNRRRWPTTPSASRPPPAAASRRLQAAVTASATSASPACRRRRSGELAGRRDGVDRRNEERPGVAVRRPATRRSAESCASTRRRLHDPRSRERPRPARDVVADRERLLVDDDATSAGVDFARARRARDRRARWPPTATSGFSAACPRAAARRSLPR